MLRSFSRYSSSDMFEFRMMLLKITWTYRNTPAIISKMAPAYSQSVRLVCLVLRIFLNMSFLVTNEHPTKKMISSEVTITAPRELNSCPSA